MEKVVHSDAIHLKTSALIAAMERKSDFLGNHDKRIGPINHSTDQPKGGRKGS